MAAGKQSKWFEESMGLKEKAERRYFERIRDKAAELGSDGCTGGTGAFKDCCREHDVHWRTGRMLDGTPISPRAANRRFLACMRNHSRFGYYSPMALIRFVVVSVIPQPKHNADTATL